MKASELVEELKVMISQYGDLEVYVGNFNHDLVEYINYEEQSEFYDYKTIFELN